MIVFMSVWLCIVSVLDIRSRRVPVWMLVIGGSAALLGFSFQCVNGGWEYTDALKAFLPGFLLLALAFVTKKAGYGDGIALLCVGALLEGGRSLLLFGISLFLISIWSIGLLIFRKASKEEGIPYLPFLTAAWFAVMTLW